MKCRTYKIITNCRGSQYKLKLNNCLKDVYITNTNTVSYPHSHTSTHTLATSTKRKQIRLLSYQTTCFRVAPTDTQTANQRED